MSHISPVIGESFVDTLRSMLGLQHPAPSELRDVRDIARCVAMHARSLGCTESNITAAVAYALRHGGHTLACIRIGKARAAQLAERQRHHTPPTAA